MNFHANFHAPCVKPDRAHQLFFRQVHAWLNVKLDTDAVFAQAEGRIGHDVTPHTEPASATRPGQTPFNVAKPYLPNVPVIARNTRPTIQTVNPVLDITMAGDFIFGGQEYNARTGPRGFQYKQQSPRRGFVSRSDCMMLGALHPGICTKENEAVHALFREAYIKTARSKYAVARTLEELKNLPENSMFLTKSQPELLLKIIGNAKSRVVSLEGVLSGKTICPRLTSLKIRTLKSGYLEGLTTNQLNLYKVLRGQITV